MIDRGEVARLKRLIACARGEEPCDLVIRGAKVVNVFDMSVEETDVAVREGVVVGLGRYTEARETVEADGLYLTPGFMDGHIHIESTMLAPARFAEAAAIRGTTAVVADPHEIANVLGSQGIRYMLKASEGLPVDFFFMLPSCVPATHLETAGAELSSRDLAKFMDRPRILGLAEMMNFPGVIQGMEEVLEKLVLFKDRAEDGHSPLLSGLDLNAYLLAGPASDHECTNLQEAAEKLRRGMFVMIREGSQARNLKDLAPLLTRDTARRIMLVSDDRHPEELEDLGHMDHILRRAVEEGVDPLVAVSLVTLNPARYFGLRRRGAIAPGYVADLCLVEDLTSFKVKVAYKNGKPMAREGSLVGFAASPYEVLGMGAMELAPVTAEKFSIPKKHGEAKVIGLVPGQILTRKLSVEPKTRDGFVTSDVERDILKLAVLERHMGTGNVGLGLVQGFGLKRGALASSVAHDSHNIIAVGATDESLAAAAERVRELGGGLVAADDSGVLAELALPIGGLMSPEPVSEVARKNKEVLEAAKGLGSTHENPFMALSFLALPVIPELKLTDMGLVDVTSFSLVDLFD